MRAEHKNIFLDLQNLAKAQAKAFRLAGRDVVSYAVSQFVKRAQDLTIRAVGRPPGRGMAATVAEAKREYAEYLALRIRGVRFRKWGDARLGTQRGRIKARHIFANRLAKKEIPAYLRRAKALQGRFAAGWNAAAMAKKLSVPAWVKRHGIRDGHWNPMVRENIYSETVIFDAPSKGAGHGNIEFVVNTASRAVQKELAAAATKFLAANVRRHVKKLSKS